MPNYDWYSKDDFNIRIRRAAADAFLSDVLDPTSGIADAVTGMDQKKRQNAHKEFNTRVQAAVQAATGHPGDLPQNVEVICLPADTTARSDLVVFILYAKTAKIQRPESPADTGLWEQRWTAAWPPY